MNMKQEKILLAVVLSVLMLGIAYVAYDGLRGFHTEVYNGHEYVFYGNKPFEHKIDCKKCLDKFD